MNVNLHRNREANAITAVMAAVCALGCASALVPGVEHAVTIGLAVLGGLALVAVGIRLAGRWLRERREDRADALAAAVWRAENRPSHVVRPHALDDARSMRGAA